MLRGGCATLISGFPKEVLEVGLDITYCLASQLHWTLYCSSSNLCFGVLVPFYVEELKIEGVTFFNDCCDCKEDISVVIPSLYHLVGV